MIRPSLGLFLVLSGISAQTANALRPGVCSLDPPPDQVSRASIFSPQQEQWLGDAQADMVEPRYSLEPAAASQYLSEIGQKLVAQLPHDSIHYTFRIFESQDMRTFSLAGGHVYISRKLVLDARSEDELAAMLAQEIGRNYVHHAASVVTLRLKKMLDVKEVGDQADIVDKFQRLLNIPIPGSAQLHPEDQEKDELLADRVGLYILIKAGYAPQAFTSFLDRITMNGGFTGNFFSDLFETTPEVSVRIRQAHKVIDALPDSCRIERPKYRPRFKPFQNAQAEKPVDPILPESPGLQFSALQPPMSPALENVRLSPNGKFVLAQDESQIHVFGTDPMKLLFSIDARDAEMAHFTPDSTSIVFDYDSLRVESWSVVTHQPEGVLDFPDYFGCQQSSLSPGGSDFACITQIGNQLWLRLIDLRTGELIYQNANFHGFGVYDQSIIANQWDLANLVWSPDGHYFLAVSGSNRVAIDLIDRKQVKLEGMLGDLYQGRVAFVGSDALVFDCKWSDAAWMPGMQFSMCYVSFPEGKELRTFKTGFQWIDGITSGRDVSMGPNDHSAAALFDPAAGTSNEGFALEPVDLAESELAVESPQGGIAVGKAGSEFHTIPVPVTPIPFLEAGAFSADGKFLAISDRARSAVWDLASGKRTASMGPCRAVAFNSADRLQAIFLNQELTPSSHPEIDWKTRKMVRVVNVGGSQMQFGSVLATLAPTDPKSGFVGDVTMNIADAASGARLWTMRFPNGVPGLTPADSGKLLLTAAWNSDAASELMHGNKSKFLHSSDSIGKYDQYGLLVAILDGRTGIADRLLLVPEMASDNEDPRSVALYGDLLAVHGNRNNTVVYRTADGKRMMAFPGRFLAGDSEMGLIAATNRLQELTVYDVATGKAVQSVNLDQAPLLARFIAVKNALLVLSGSQRVYTFDLAKTKPSNASR